MRKGVPEFPTGPSAPRVHPPGEPPKPQPVAGRRPPGHGDCPILVIKIVEIKCVPVLKVPNDSSLDPHGHPLAHRCGHGGPAAGATGAISYLHWNILK
jgi:hypothetical protein